jgi:hypothetical protein
MIKHVVLFKFDNPSLAYLNKVVSMLENLKNEIEEIISLEVGINTNKDEKFHIGLTVVLRNFAALNTYANHPKHLDVVKVVREKISDRACVDYEI